MESKQSVFSTQGPTLANPAGDSYTVNPPFPSSAGGM